MNGSNTQIINNIVNNDGILMNQNSTTKVNSVKALDNYFSQTSKTLENKTLNNPDITGRIELKNQGELRFNDSDNSNYIAIKSADNVPQNINYMLPNEPTTRSIFKCYTR